MGTWRRSHHCVTRQESQRAIPVQVAAELGSSTGVTPATMASLHSIATHESFLKRWSSSMYLKRFRWRARTLGRRLMRMHFFASCSEQHVSQKNLLSSRRDSLEEKFLMQADTDEFCSISTLRSRNRSSREVRLSQHMHRVSLVRTPSKVECIQVFGLYSPFGLPPLEVEPLSSSASPLPFSSDSLTSVPLRSACFCSASSFCFFSRSSADSFKR
mmetsp:Transcript_16876/g.47032  ORF Transcript_16876/g.47032 Transcript_16876/m.47032 type:complete len:215 (-) Transcript_16876:484-1128(-)|eukprot:scaffold92055_cov33-Tisochrysis_lutea.AAC.7